MPRIAALLTNAVLLVGAVVTLLPLVWMVSVSLMSPGEASRFPPPLLPHQATFANYRELFARAGMGRYLFNSVVLAAVTLAGMLATSLPAAYAFAKLRFPGKEALFALLER